MRKWIALLLVVILIVGQNFSVGVAAAKDIKLYINGNEYTLSVKPVVKKKMVYLPLVETGQALNANISEGKNKNSYILTRGEKTASIVINSKKALINGENMTLKAKPYLNKNTVMVPADFLCSTLKISMKYSASTGKISFTDESLKQTTEIGKQTEKIVFNPDVWQPIGEFPLRTVTGDWNQIIIETTDNETHDSKHGTMYVFGVTPEKGKYLSIVKTGSFGNVDISASFTTTQYCQYGFYVRGDSSKLTDKGDWNSYYEFVYDQWEETYAVIKKANGKRSLLKEFTIFGKPYDDYVSKPLTWGSNHFYEFRVKVEGNDLYFYYITYDGKSELLWHGTDYALGAGDVGLFVKEEVEPEPGTFVLIRRMSFTAQ